MAFIKFPKSVLISILVILGIRVAAFPLQSFTVDMGAWQAWAIRLTQLGPWQFYDPVIWTNYTPGYLLFLWIFGFIFEISGVSPATPPFELFIKIVSTVFDLACTYLIYHIVAKHATKKLAYIAGLLYFANIAAIFNASVWGQIDGILTFFLLLSTYWIYEKRNVVISSAAYFYSILIKPQAIALAPILLLTYLNRMTGRSLVYAGALCLTIYFVVSMLFFPSNVILGLPSLIIQMIQDYPFTSLYAYNIWAIIGWWQSDNNVWLGLSYLMWGRIVYFGFVVFVSYVYIKRQYDKIPVQYYLTCTLLLFAFFLLPTRAHERYLMPMFAFLIISASLLKSRLLIVIYSLLMIIHALNLWYVYYYYLYVFDKSAENVTPFYQLISNQTILFSVLNLLMFGIIVIVFLKKNVHENTPHHTA